MKMCYPVTLPVVFLLTGCSLFDNDSPDFFTVTPVSAVEVALEINAPKGSEITIERSGTEIYSFRMSQADTVIYDSGLSPATSYIWKTTRSGGRGRTIERQATTLDTTSSNFTWQTFSFGEHSSRMLYGVSIIDENNIWAVGEIHMNDSTGQEDSQIYNAVHWDGNEWELERVPFEECGILYPRIRASFSFGETDHWFARGGGITRYDGVDYTTDCRMNDILAGSINKIWGNGPQDLYAVGGKGTIVHFNGNSWQKIETNTELDFYDIHGNEQQGVVAVAAKLFVNLYKEIIRIADDQTTKVLSTDGIPEPISGIWFDEQGVTYSVGSGMFRKPGLDSKTAWQAFHKPITNNYMDAIDANGLNDIVVSGNSGEILHFNGTEWRSFQNGLAGSLYNIDIRQNIVAAVGYDGSKAFLKIGRRE